MGSGIGLEHDVAATTLDGLRAPAVSYRGRSNFLCQMACGLGVDSPFACVLHRLPAHGTWGKSTSLWGEAPSTCSWRESQDHFHFLIRTLRHVQRCLKLPLKVGEPLLSMHRIRMCVLVALRARFERDRSCTVWVHERSYPSGGRNLIAGPRGL